MKQLLLFIFIISCISCANISQNKNPTENKKYNIIWLVAEDQSPQFFPMYGDSSISLPNLESIAKESIVYDKAFANVPVCAPARSTIILGMYTIATATHNMRTYNSHLHEIEPSIGLVGYTPVMPKHTKEFPKYLRSEGYYCTNNSKEDYNMQISDGTWDESSSKATWRNRKEGQPFFSVFNFMECHESGIWRFGKDSLFVDPKGIPVPPYFPDNDIIRHDLAVNYSNLKRIDDKIGTIINQLKEDGLYDDSYIFFYGDHGGPFPRHKRVLYDTGLEVPFFVKLPKDLMQDKGQTRNDDIISFIDLAPTVLSIAGIEKPDQMQGKAFLGSYIGPKDEYIYASSDRFDAIYDKSRAIRSKKYKYIRNYHPELPYAIPVEYREQMPMMKEWRRLDSIGALSGSSALWMRKNKDPEEFYDLEVDPFELNNIINEANKKSVIDAHRSALDAWLEKCDDQGKFDERELISKWATLKEKTILKAPTISVESELIMAKNEGEYGNIVYKIENDSIWQVYSKPLAGMSDTKLVFKTVHIGLDDSPESRNK